MKLQRSKLWATAWGRTPETASDPSRLIDASSPPSLPATPDLSAVQMRRWELPLSLQRWAPSPADTVCVTPPHYPPLAPHFLTTVTFFIVCHYYWNPDKNKRETWHSGRLFKSELNQTLLLPNLQVSFRSQVLTDEKHRRHAWEPGRRPPSPPRTQHIPEDAALIYLEKLECTRHYPCPHGDGKLF